MNFSPKKGTILLQWRYIFLL